MVNIAEVLVVGIVLSADSFSAALAIGARPHRRIDALKFAITSGGAEAIVALLGSVTGAKVLAEYDSIDHWISFVLLSFVAFHMLQEGYLDFKNKESCHETPKVFHGSLRLLVVALATSLDAFAVGMSLGVSERTLTPYILSIGFAAFAATLTGMKISQKVSSKIGPAFSLLGAVVLLSLAIKLLVDGL